MLGTGNRRLDLEAAGAMREIREGREINCAYAVRSSDNGTTGCSRAAGLRGLLLGRLLSHLGIPDCLSKATCLPCDAEGREWPWVQVSA